MNRGEIVESLDRLQSFFDRKYEDLLESEEPLSDQWIDYCDLLKVRIIDVESIQMCFNNEPEGYVCLFNPEPPENAREFHWLLVPLDLAERALMLGGIP